MMKNLRPFHLAIPVNDLGAARAFYGGLLGCAEGRSDRQWVDFDFHGHQLVCHLDTRPDRAADLHHPAGNHIELKAFASLEQLFAR